MILIKKKIYETYDKNGLTRKSVTIWLFGWVIYNQVYQYQEEANPRVGFIDNKSKN